MNFLKILCLVFVVQIYAQFVSVNQFVEVNSATEAQRTVAESTVTLIKRSSLRVSTDGSIAVTYEAPTLQERGFCPDQLYADQPSLGFCSGSLVSNDVILTAGHCLENLRDCRDTMFVFDFNNEVVNTPAGERSLPPNQIPIDNLYGCSEILFQQFSGDLDIALVKLTRPVVSRTPLSWRRSGQPRIGESLHLVSSPMGMPQKVSEGSLSEAYIMAGYQSTFVTLGGSSGGAVMNSENNFIEGVHISGPRNRYVVNDQGCLIWRDINNSLYRGRTVNYDSLGQRWVQGTGFVPVSYFIEHLERFAGRSSGSTDASGRGVE